MRANIVLLALNFTLLFLVAFAPMPYRDTLNKILLSTIFLTSVYVLGSRVKWILGFVLILIAVQWTAKIMDDHPIVIAAGILNSLFFIYVIVRLVTQFATARNVSRLVILGAINGYLLLGLVFSIGMLLISNLFPESYYLAREDAFLTAGSDFHTYIYHTFVTMATVGYGDIAPVGEEARGLAILISVTGQLYIAVVIAFIVGKYAGKSHGAD